MSMQVRRMERRNPTFWDQLESLQEEVDRLLDAAFAAAGASSTLWGEHAPAVDLVEESDRLVLRVDLPGMRREDIQVTLHDGCVTVAGERRADERYARAQVHRAERVLGRFQRTISLPVPVAADQITARYRDGVLEVVLPKAEEARPKQIQVQTD
ncbi:Hsp20/alpha crystallin family protein [Limisphaera ngatamarikiensis]|jgi:HSP20 family protein|uniref:Hsp20/alpha crystallin family protein n=1 Tax=Limisphaera ngatamarikiensis TaxID=1324935 RepID=A0A6M1S042_9BACT|nr:Hsp20/alpha crystallin family protein [Limisphaera ngatamarikiensis]NGO38740.1 Hsp20/alpha crystallin family protein [Limisphaera ngatamarikiensis]